MWLWISVAVMYAAVWSLVPYFGLSKNLIWMALSLSGVAGAIFGFSTFGGSPAPLGFLWIVISWAAYTLVATVTLILVSDWWWRTYYDCTKSQLRVRGAFFSAILLVVFVGPFDAVRLFF